MLELKHLCKNYMNGKEDTPCLKDINLSFPDVQFVSIIGPSGCGKTTLLNCIGTLDKITSGEIICNGKNVETLTDKELNLYRNNDIGFIFQNYYLIPQLTVLENITIALSVQSFKDDINALGMEALKRVGMEKFAKKKPTTLSGGQKQKVAIARAIVTSPSIILADEPTGSLDSKSSIEVMDILKDISKNRLVIMVTHNNELADTYSDRIIKIKDGEIQDDIIKNECDLKAKVIKARRPSHLAWKSTFKIAGSNLISRKVKTIFTSIANSLGMLGIGFLISINTGFNNYSDRLMGEAASSLPIVVGAYNVQKAYSKDEINENAEYPKDKEIYPSLSSSTEYTFSHNGITPKFLNYLEYLKNSKHLINDYVISNENNFPFNLVTDFPQSIDGLHEGEVDTVYTNYRSKNSNASDAELPDNIFHVLYGDTKGYDLLAGNMPKEEGDLVLVVDKCNRVGFTILRLLGFYNDNDLESDVLNKDALSNNDNNNAKKVKPITFDDIIGKRYKLYFNKDFYTDCSTLDPNTEEGKSYYIEKQTIQSLTDPNDPNNPFYEKKSSVYKKNTSKIINDYKKTDPENSSVNQSNTNPIDMGIELKITGVIRAKPTTSISILSPSLCYSRSLQERLYNERKDSQICEDFKKNLVCDRVDITDPEKQEEIKSEFEQLKSYFENSSSGKSEDISKLRDMVNEIINRYFSYYPIFPKKDDTLNKYVQQTKITSDPSYYFRQDAYTLGASLITEEMNGRNLADQDTFQEIYEDIKDKMIKEDAEDLDNLELKDIDVDFLYEEVISLMAYVNQYYESNGIIIFPKDLQSKEKLKAALDEYNNLSEIEYQKDKDGNEILDTDGNKIKIDDPYHATSTSQRVYYFNEEEIDLIENVKIAIVLATSVLTIFAIICLVISATLTALLVYNSVNERTKEIGLLRALGTRKLDVLKLFELESLFIGLLAGIIGSLLTFALSYPLNAIISGIVDSSYPLGNIVYVSPLMFVIVIASSMLITFIAALIPSIIATKVTPIESLRKE